MAAVCMTVLLASVAAALAVAALPKAVLKDQEASAMQQLRRL